MLQLEGGGSGATALIAVRWYCTWANTPPAPGAGNVGYIDTTINLSALGDLAPGFDWDNNVDFDYDPSAQTNFGLYSGNKTNI